MRDEREIQEMADKAADACQGPTKFRNATYEEGVRCALDWVLDDTMSEDESPL